MNQKVVIVGYGGHGLVAVDILQTMSIRVVGYCDTTEKQANPYAVPYLGNEDDYLEDFDRSINFFVAIGDNRTRERVSRKIINKGAVIINAIHRASTVSSIASIKQGVMVGAHAVINPLCHISEGVICNTSSVVEHECTIGAYAHIAPGTVLCGNVTVGERCFIGANSVVKEGISIINDVVIGAGSVVVDDLSQPGLYVGCPAKKIK